MIIDAGDDFVVAGLLVEVHVVVLVVGAVGVAVLVVVVVVAPVKVSGI